MKEIINKLKAIKQVLPKRKKREPSERYLKVIGFFNRYSLIFHVIIACLIVFAVEFTSRRSLGSTFTFFNHHTKAFFYNAFIVFSSLSLVYLFRRRTFWRFITIGFWMFLGIVNGCILSNRVTPFGYTDLKCIPELLAMSDNTNYFTPEQISMVVFGVCAFLAFCLFLFIKGPKYKGKMHLVTMSFAILLLWFVGLPVTTQAAQNTNVVESYFANIAQGYEDYGFIYGFSCSVMDRGMNKPSDYSQDTVETVMKQIKKEKQKTTVKKKDQPNIICVLLESFCDPEEITFLSTNKDPIPTFHKLEKKFSSGYLTVPVVGAGTANTEFEVLTGMSMEYFGTGEYPYKTVLKKTNCESIASDLSSIGYGTHAIHNNGGNFYSRVNAFSMFGFDSFTSKEMMDIREYTPNGNWATDYIMVDETMKALDTTPDQADFAYIMTVGSHGDYPTEPVIENPTYTVSGVEDEAAANQWTYYVNQLNEVDTFLKQLIEAVEERGEDTIIVGFGDHLPTMGLENSDMKSKDIYKTKYITWNNMGLQKSDADLYAYQLLASTTGSAGIHEGTMMTYHQTQMNTPDVEKYESGMENLQYDILYGDHYCYDGENPYPATDIVMGTQDVVITKVKKGFDGYRIFLNGENFTKWSKVYVNGEKVYTDYINGSLLAIRCKDVPDGATLVVNQVGSGDSIFRSSNEWTYQEPQEDTEADEEESTAAPVEEKTEELQ